MPEHVRIAFQSFSDINDSETYSPPSRHLLPQEASIDSGFNFTEWWKIAEGEILKKLFDLGKELVAGLLRVLEAVSALFYM